MENIEKIKKIDKKFKIANKNYFKLKSIKHKIELPSCFVIAFLLVPLFFVSVINREITFYIGIILCLSLSFIWFREFKLNINKKRKIIINKIEKYRAKLSELRDLKDISIKELKIDDFNSIDPKKINGQLLDEILNKNITDTTAICVFNVTQRMKSGANSSDTRLLDEFNENLRKEIIHYNANHRIERLNSLKNENVVEQKLEIKNI